MADSFYYQDHENRVQGPLAPAALKQLAAEGVIVGSTLVRRGDEGPWYEAGKIPGLLTPRAAEAAAAPVMEPDSSDRTLRTIRKAEEQAEKVAAKLWFLDLKFSQFFTPKLVGAVWLIFVFLMFYRFLGSAGHYLVVEHVWWSPFAMLGELILLAFAVIASRVVLEMILVVFRIADRLEPLKHLENLQHLGNPPHDPSGTPLR